MEKIELGDTVRHRISGFTGTAIGRTIWISGCDRITVQPKVDKQGKMQENSSFDEPEMDIIKKAKRKVPSPRKTGGPHSVATKREDAKHH